MASDPLDRIERMLIRCIEEDRRQRRREREKKRNPDPHSEWQKTRDDFLDRHRRRKSDSDPRESPSDGEE